MARQKQQKARKDYPEQGIKKGDLYWFAKIKTSHTTSRVIRSLTKIPQSRMTVNEYKSAYYATQESWEASDKSPDAMRTVAEEIREIGEGVQERYDNMPEGLQQGETGQMLETRAGELETIADEFDQFADTLESLDRADYADEEEMEAQIESTVEEADSRLQEMPE